MAAIEEREGEIHLHVKVVPGASRTRIMGEAGGRLRVAVSAAPEKGIANKALCEFIAACLSLRKRDVVVIRGMTSPRKTLGIRGTTVDEVRLAIAAG